MICQSFTVTSFWSLAIRMLHYWCYGLIRDRKQRFPTTEKIMQQSIRFQHAYDSGMRAQGLMGKAKAVRVTHLIWYLSRRYTVPLMSMKFGDCCFCPASLGGASSGVRFLYDYDFLSSDWLHSHSPPWRSRNSGLFLSLAPSLSLFTWVLLTAGVYAVPGTGEWTNSTEF